MTRFTLLMTLAAGAAAYFSIIDRSSALALDIVELETQLGAPLWGLCGGLALASFGINALFFGPKKHQAPRAAPKSSSTQHATRSSSRQAALPTFSGGDWLSEIIESAKALNLPSGARLTHNTRGTHPFELHLEHAPPERCRRAITEVAQWICAVPRPPRLKIHFKNCPDGGSPWHHRVAGAMATAIPRSDFKVTTGLDSVEVMFLNPDERWASQSHRT